MEGLILLGSLSLRSGAFIHELIINGESGDYSHRGHRRDDDAVYPRIGAASGVFSAAGRICVGLGTHTGFYSKG